MPSSCSRSQRLARAALVAASIALVPFASQAAEGGNAEAAKDKVSMCIGCHGIPGYKTAFPLVYHVPRISGQTAKYIENALLAYKKGDRSHPSMQAIAGSLSEQDIADLAAYYSSR
jgi:cytochrome c553